MNANVTFIYNDVVQSYELRGDAVSKKCVIDVIFRLRTQSLF